MRVNAVAADPVKPAESAFVPGDAVLNAKFGDEWLVGPVEENPVDWENDAGAIDEKPTLSEFVPGAVVANENEPGE